MAFIAIPAAPDGYPDKTVQVPINGITYTIRWQWNEGTGAWFFSLSDAAGPILGGVRVAVNNDLLAYTADPRKPDGAMMVVAPDRDERDPQLDDFGTRVQVVFIDSADVKAAKAEAG